MQRLIQAATWAAIGAILLGGLSLIFDFVEATIEPDSETLNAAFSTIAALLGVIAGGIYGAVFRQPGK